MHAPEARALKAVQASAEAGACAAAAVAGAAAEADTAAAPRRRRGAERVFGVQRAGAPPEASRR
jgi:uncharacterized membrane protein